MTQYEKCEDLPPCAWLATVAANVNETKIIHGSSVIADRDFFFEGAWAGDFNEGDFDRNYSFGSGARFRDDTIVFVPPSHTLDHLNFYISDGEIIISNSLAFLLEYMKDSLILDSFDVIDKLNDISAGLSKSVINLITTKGKKISLLFYCHIVIADNLTITFRQPVFSEVFSDYSSYVSFIKTILSATFENMNHYRRKVTYRPLATMSSGYDSSTIAAWAAAVGCEEAVTFSSARSKQNVSDSGEPIASCIKITIINHDRFAYKEFSDMPEIECWGVGSEMLSLRETLTGRALLTGYMGDTMWDREPMEVSTQLKWKLRAGQNLGEMRLRWNFVHIPVAFVGALQGPQIKKISNLAEMRPFTLFNDYDRPICRRTLEERGVPRQLFGQKKLATGVFYKIEGLEQTMTDNSYADYRNFYEVHMNKFLIVKKSLLSLIFKLRNLNERARKKLYYKIRKYTNIKISLPIVVPRLASAQEGAVLFHWSLEKLQLRYRNALKKCNLA